MPSLVNAVFILLKVGHVENKMLYTLYWYIFIKLSLRSRREFAPLIELQIHTKYSSLLSLLYRAGCFNLFFIFPTHALQFFITNVN